MSMRDLFQMEDFEKNEATSEDADVSEVPEEELASITEADVIENKIEDAVEDALQMEAYIEKIMSFKANGGMSAETASLAQMQLEGFAKRNYLPQGSFPQMEDFDGTSGKHNATNIVLEGFKATMKKWWDNIVKWLRSFAKSIVKFWQKYISFSGQLAKKAKALEAKCRDKSGEPTEKELKLSAGQVKTLQGSDGKVTEAGITSGLSTMEAEVKRCSSDTTASANIKRCAQALEGAKVDSIDSLKEWKGDGVVPVQTAVSEFVSAIKGKVTKDKVSGDLEKVIVNPSANNVYVYSGELIGKQYIVGQFIAEDGNLTSLKIGMKYTGKAKLEEQSIKALSVSEISDLAKEVGSLATAISNAKTNYQERAKLTDEIIKAGDKITKAVAKLDDAASKDAAAKTKLTRLRSRVYQLVNTASSVMEPQADLQKHGMAVANAAFNYATKSFSNIKAKKED
jgi:hypothetical protein